MATADSIQQAQIDLKKDLYYWPPKKQTYIPNYMGTGVPVYNQMFGCLDETEYSPFRRISVANIGFSLDPTKGCPLKCSYCVRLSNKTDGLFDANTPMEDQKVFGVLPKVEVSGEELIRALVTHPAFFPNKSILTISTGSSEAFAPVCEHETYKILNELRNVHKLSNPVWIVTKLGIPDQYLDKWVNLFKEFTKLGTIVLSVTSSGLPAEIEINQKDRFKFVEKLENSGLYISHHLRPIIAGVNDSRESLAQQLKRSLPLVKSVCVGGLRLDPGIKIAWQDISKLSPDLLPNKPGEKDLPAHVLPTVRELMDEMGYAATPLFVHSAHVVAHASGIGDPCLSEFTNVQKQKGKGYVLGVHVSEKLNPSEVEDKLTKLMVEALNKLKLNFTFKVFTENDMVVLKLDQTELMEDYRISKMLVQTIGHFNNQYKYFETDIYNFWRKYE